MAILRSSDGKFYDVDDSVLAGKEVKPENAPQGAQGGSPPDGGGGIGGLGGLIQIIVNVPPGGGGSPDAGQGAPAGDEGDVEGHRRCWGNYWRNCWRNYWRNYYGY